MFNRSVRREAVEKLRSALRDHENLRKQVERASVQLFEQRQRAVAEVMRAGRGVREPSGAFAQGVRQVGA